MKKVLICDYTNALEPNYEPTISGMSEAFGEPVECLIRPYVSDEELVQELAGASGLITGFLEIGEEILAQVPDLACISVSGVGYSNIDVAAAKRHHVAVCHIREYCTEEVAEHTFALIGALNRHLKYYTKRVEEEHEWKYQTIGGEKNLSGQTLAIFGFGKIGKRVAALAGAYGMKVLAVDPYADEKDAACRGVRLVSAGEAFAEADVITNHMNLTVENEHYFDERAFSNMQKDPIFINVGRGRCVDETALQQALDSGKIRAAGLDVLEAEAPDLTSCGLLGRENVILTPHSAFYSAESILKLQRISGANMGYFLAGAQEKIDAVVE